MAFLALSAVKGGNAMQATTLNNSAPFLDRPAAPRIAKDLPRCLRLCRRRLRPGALRSAALRFFTLCGRFFGFDLLAGVIVADLVSRAAGDFRTPVAIRLEAVIANQRADPVRLSLDRVQGVDAGGLHLQLHAGVLVEQIE